MLLGWCQNKWLTYKIYQTHWLWTKIMSDGTFIQEFEMTTVVSGSLQVDSEMPVELNTCKFLPGNVNALTARGMTRSVNEVHLHTSNVDNSTILYRERNNTTAIRHKIAPEATMEPTTSNGKDAYCSTEALTRDSFPSFAITIWCTTGSFPHLQQYHRCCRDCTLRFHGLCIMFIDVYLLENPHNNQGTAR